MSNSDPHHKPQIDISAWLEREAIECARREHTSDQKAARLREAAALIRKQRADIVTLRMGRPAPMAGKQRGFIDLRGAFYAMFAFGALAAAIVLVVLPWLWHHLKPWLHAVTS